MHKCSHTAIPDQPDAPDNPLQWPYAIIAVGVVLGVLVIGIIAIIGAKRKRASGDQGTSTGGSLSLSLTHTHTHTHTHTVTMVVLHNLIVLISTIIHSPL